MLSGDGCSAAPPPPPPGTRTGGDDDDAGDGDSTAGLPEPPVDGDAAARCMCDDVTTERPAPTKPSLAEVGDTQLVGGREPSAVGDGMRTAGSARSTMEPAATFTGEMMEWYSGGDSGDSVGSPCSGGGGDTVERRALPLPPRDDSTKSSPSSMSEDGDDAGPPTGASTHDRCRR
jgi:hypothetical protein